MVKATAITVHILSRSLTAIPKIIWVLREVFARRSIILNVNKNPQARVHKHCDVLLMILVYI